MRALRVLPLLLAGGAVLAALPAMAQQSLGPPAPTNSEPPPVQQNAAPPPKQGFSFNPDAGVVYQSGDLRVTAWGYVERAIDPDGPYYFRRVRQGAEIDFPRLSDSLRAALVYEVDLTNTNFFGDIGGSDGNVGTRNFENLVVALQHPDDPGRFRLLIGENTHILSREDNLSSGNLPTINRSAGGYRLVQFSLFDAPRAGNLDLFARYDMVSAGSAGIAGRATQQAVWAGVNYNLPHADKLASLHLEYAHNALFGPAAIVTDRNPGDEFRIVLRASLQRYLRH